MAVDKYAKLYCVWKTGNESLSKNLLLVLGALSPEYNPLFFLQRGEEGEDEGGGGEDERGRGGERGQKCSPSSAPGTNAVYTSHLTPATSAIVMLRAALKPQEEENKRNALRFLQPTISDCQTATGRQLSVLLLFGGGCQLMP